MGVVFDDEFIDLILAEADELLGEYVTSDGQMRLDDATHGVTAQV